MFPRDQQDYRRDCGIPPGEGIEGDVGVKAREGRKALCRFHGFLKAYVTWI